MEEHFLLSSQYSHNSYNCSGKRIPDDEGVETHQVVDQSFIGSIRGFISTVKPPIKGVYLYTLNICINMFMFYYGYKLWRKRPFMLQ